MAQTHTFSPRRAKEVKAASPIFQSFLKEILVDIWHARKRGDAHAYETAIFMLIHSLPPEVQADAIKYLRTMVSNQNFSGYPEDLIEIAKQECDEILSKYESFVSREVKEEKCRQIMIRYLDTIYTAVMAAIHNHGIFLTIRSYYVGWDYGGGEG